MWHCANMKRASSRGAAWDVTYGKDSPDCCCDLNLQINTHQVFHGSWTCGYTGLLQKETRGARVKTQTVLADWAALEAATAPFSEVSEHWSMPPCRIEFKVNFKWKYFHKRQLSKSIENSSENSLNWRESDLGRDFIKQCRQQRWMTADVVLSSILALYLHGFSTFVQPVVSLSFKVLVEQHYWSLVLQQWLGLV